MIRLACKTALKSTFERHRLGAVITKGGSVISTGYNEIRYTREYRQHTLHAEASAILKVLKSRRLDLLANAEIYVSRVRPNGSIGLSKPCSNCMDLIKSVGISRIHYTTDYGTIETIKV